jgi:hypothetical protein
MPSEPYESVNPSDWLQPNDCTENKLAGTGYRYPGRKLKKAIEGWVVGILGAIAIFGATFASFAYSCW